MRKKQIKKELLHMSIFIHVVFFFYFIKVMPVFTYPSISKLLGFISFSLMSSSRERIKKNLKIAYGNTFNYLERRRINIDIFSNVIMSFCELIRVTKIEDDKILAMASIEGEEKLQSALKEGNGVIGVCSHMGNFPLLETILVKKGYPANVIVKDPTAEYLAKFCRNLSKKNKIPYISKKDIKATITEAQKWLSSNKGLLSFYIDQHAGNGLSVMFFDRKVFTPTGAAVFARKYNCPAIGIFSYRIKNGSHKIIIEGPYPLKKTNNVAEDIKDNTIQFMQRVEHYVKLYPDQWFSWLHRRFR